MRKFRFAGTLRWEEENSTSKLEVDKGDTDLTTGLLAEESAPTSQSTKQKDGLQSKDAPYWLEWRDLSFTLSEAKQILKSSFGRVNSGELTALVGASGAGKTTLLNILAEKYPRSQGVASGQILFSGELIAHRNGFLKKVSSYLRQQDFFYPNLTPREVLLFALDMISRESPKQKAQKVESILNSLNLLSCADSKIGNEIIKGISGGEKRRLSLALEILTEPKIIFLDEPTSGLDSFSALLVISVLKQVAGYPDCDSGTGGL